eukprot:358327-Chlamydomonas_euryale.AAC.3
MTIPLSPRSVRFATNLAMRSMAVCTTQHGHAQRGHAAFPCSTWPCRIPGQSTGPWALACMQATCASDFAVYVHARPGRVQSWCPP